MIYNLRFFIFKKLKTGHEWKWRSEFEEERWYPIRVCVQNKIFVTRITEEETSVWVLNDCCIKETGCYFLNTPLALVSEP